ncbi:MAG: isoprenylcysteine carboxyl methyltransferase family protein [Kiloniellales bacterium]
MALQRLVELAIVSRNTRRLKSEGAIEVGAGHYPAFVLLHASWLLVCFFVAGVGDTQVHWLAFAAYLLLQVARVWTIVSLGRNWTVRVLTLPGRPLIRRGPYRWVRHPNYLIVALEIPLLPLAIGAWLAALVFGCANLVLLAYRIRIEDAVLAPRQALHE